MDFDVYIIDKEEKLRSLDTRDSKPRSLSTIQGKGTTYLGALINQLKTKGISNVTYIGNYHMEKVIESHPQLAFKVVRSQQAFDWLQSIEASTSREILLLSGHVLYLESAIEKILQTKESLALVDGKPVAWSLSPKTMKGITQQLQAREGQDKKTSFSALFKINQKRKMFDAYDISDSSAFAKDSRGINRLVLQGKAKTLENLKSLIQTATVKDLLRFNYQTWRTQQPQVIANVLETFKSAKHLIVRSSCTDEDTNTTSLAGAFETCLDVSCHPKALIQAVETVIESYQKGQRELQDDDEILVQEQVDDLVANGVLFTRIADTGAPYFVVSLDRTRNAKDGVTSGKAEVETSYAAWNTPQACLSEDVSRCIELARELMTVLIDQDIDVEFGIDSSQTLYLFQVRPLVTRKTFPFQDSEFLSSLHLAQNYLQAKATPVPDCYGQHTLWGVMPDWNPAEMIGLHPKPLSFSLYHHLITSQSWSKARHDLGYKHVHAQHLMCQILGSPYIDVRASVNSLLPKNLEGDYLHKYVDYALNTLIENPQWHDKLEFEVALHSLTPNWPSHRLAQAGLTSQQIDTTRKAYRQLTQDIILNSASLTQSFLTTTLPAMNKVSLWWDGIRQQHSEQAHLATLLRHIQYYGIVPFARFARMAFITQCYFKDFVQMGVLSQAQVDHFFAHIPTVASEFTQDQAQYYRGDLSSEQMVERYGHLRPNSYDILSANYAQMTNWLNRSKEHPVHVSTSFKAQDVVEDFSGIESVLKEMKLAIPLTTFLSFAKESTQLRERAKFEFMKLVNLALEACKTIAGQLGLTHEEASFLPIQAFIDLSINPPVFGGDYQLKKVSRFEQKRWLLTNAVTLPDLITSPMDVFTFRQQPSKPNYITQQQVTADVVALSKERTDNLEGKIVLIEAADPGFDWIFSHAIKGLITAYGGVASHMAIRCSEFQIPAAIGCGMSTFTQLETAQRLTLNCLEQSLKVES